MDPESYERQARAEDTKAAAAMRKRGQLEESAAKRETKALKAETSAHSTTSDSTRRSREREAASERKTAAAEREKAAAEATKAGKAQTSAIALRQKASNAREQNAKRAESDARRQAQEQQRRARQVERDAERERRRRETFDQDVVSGLDALRSRTDDLAAQVAASRARAPHTITALLMAGTINGAKYPLQLAREHREVDLKVQSSRYRDQIDLQYAQATQVRDILGALNRYRPGIVHFSGHGSEEELVFEGPDGTPQPLSGDQLAVLLAASGAPIRLVVFNACQSARQARAATSFADFAIGMERPINDGVAKEWAGQLYGSLAEGLPLAVAFEQANALAATIASPGVSLGDPQLFANEGSDPATTVLVAPDEHQAKDV